MPYFGSEQMAANFSSRLLLPIPQSPSTAKELIRPAARPCCRARVNASLWVLLRVGGSLRGLVCGFGNEGVVLNEGAGDYSFRPVDSELDECKRDPLVAWLEDAGLAENDFLRYEVMREAVSFTCHEAPPVCGFRVCGLGR